MTVPTVENVRRHNGIAGQFSYTVDVTYPDESPSQVTFVGSTYGPPIVMVTPDGIEVFVSERVLDRIGRRLDPDWVRAFFDPEVIR